MKTSTSYVIYTYHYIYIKFVILYYYILKINLKILDNIVTLQKIYGFLLNLYFKILNDLTIYTNKLNLLDLK